MNAETESTLDLGRAAQGPPSQREPQLKRTGSNKGGLLLAAERYGLVGLLIGIVVMFSLIPATSALFPTPSNVTNLLGNQSVLAVVALASIVPLITGQFDLSVGVIMGVSSLVVAGVTRDMGLSLPAAIAASLLLGLLVGSLNGCLVAYVGVNALICTLGVSTALLGIASAYTQNPILDVPVALTQFGVASFLGIPAVSFVIIAIAAVVMYILGYTPFGRRLEAVGSSVSAARLVGIRVERVQFQSFLLSGLLAAVAGVLQAGRSSVGDATVGTSFLLPALAAAFLGATAIKPGKFNVLGTIVAIFFVASAVSGLTLAGIEPWIQDVFNGGALVIGVTLSAVIARRRRGASST